MNFDILWKSDDGLQTTQLLTAEITDIDILLYKYRV